MTAGIRVMTMILMLKTEAAREATNHEIVNRVKQSIQQHQEFLEDSRNFSWMSNHGMWHAMGLFETTRVFPNPTTTDLALDRLLALANRSVSEKGVHKENALSYHFWFFKWLSHYVAYLNGLKLAGWEGLDKLSSIEQRMRGSAYYLCDHSGKVPQIGDTDAKTIDMGTREAADRKQTDVMFDDEGGYAVFKENPSSNNKRYVLFVVRNFAHPPLSLKHTHRDALAVYFSEDGEIILGDQGRYENPDSAPRRYFRSSAAHNTIVASKNFDSNESVFGVISAKSADWEQDSDVVVFQAGYGQGLVSRRVEIPRDKALVRIEDTLSEGNDFVILWNIGCDVVDLEMRGVVETCEETVYQWTLTTKRGRKFLLRMTLSKELDPEESEVNIVEGATDPMLGWYSESWHVMVPSPVIKFTLRTRGQSKVVTEIEREHS
jgi:hypothetical protein